MIRCECQQPAADFDAWQQNPYTKVLMKSIAEDYVPKHDQQSAAVDEESVVVPRWFMEKLAKDTRVIGMFEMSAAIRRVALAAQPQGDLS